METEVDNVSKELPLILSTKSGRDRYIQLLCNLSTATGTLMSCIIQRNQVAV